MYTLRVARKRAAAMTQMRAEKWIVFKPSANAPCNKYPANLFNTGPYSYCPERDRAVYEMYGAEFPE